jgi:hypothetical protein
MKTQKLFNNIDITQTQRIARSRKKITKLLLGMMLLIGLAIWLAQGGAVDGAHGKLSIYVGWFGLLVFGPIALAFLQQLIFTPGDPLEISPDGFRDARVMRNRLR